MAAHATDDRHQDDIAGKYIVLQWRMFHRYLLQITRFRLSSVMPSFGGLLHVFHFVEFDLHEVYHAFGRIFGTLFLFSFVWEPYVAVERCPQHYVDISGNPSTVRNILIVINIQCGALPDRELLCTDACQNLRSVILVYLIIT